MAYFLVPDFIFEFKKNLRKSMAINRNTDLPQVFKEIAHNASPDLNTYGDLAFVKVAIAEDPLNDEFKKYVNLLDELKRRGFDESILERLDGN